MRKQTIIARIKVALLNAIKLLQKNLLKKKFENNIKNFVCSTKEALEKQKRQIASLQQVIDVFRISASYRELPSEDKIEINAVDRELEELIINIGKLYVSIGLLSSEKLPYLTVASLMEMANLKLRGIQEALDKTHGYLSTKIPSSFLQEIS